MVDNFKNKIVKELLTLKERKGRDEKGLFLVEGLKFVLEIPDSWEIERYVISNGFKEYNNLMRFEKRSEILLVSDKVFKRISDTLSPQGIIAVCKKPEYDIKDLIKEKGFFIAAEKMSDPGNLGTIIRTAWAFGAKGVFLSKGSVDLYNGKTLRSTMGAIFYVPVVQEVDLIDLCGIFRKNGVKIYAAHLKGSEITKEAGIDVPCAFLIGNEAAGLSLELSSEADFLLKIPMPGQAESLNAAVAAGILMYEAVIAGKT